MTPLDVLVVGGGQSGLGAGYFLKRSGLTFQIVDDGTRAGGSWINYWNSLQLFSPAQWSSLPGWPMPAGSGTYPHRDEVIAYLAAYEARYALPVRRPVHVHAITRGDGALVAATSAGDIAARAVLMCTGNFRAPHIPRLPGHELFAGRSLHSAQYRRPGEFAGQRVLVVGGGNSGAQIFAELVDVADATWVTLEEPVLLPDDVDGRVLFERATLRYQAQQAGLPPPDLPGGFGDVVMVPPVRAVRDRGLLTAVRPFDRFTRDGVVWPDGREEAVDAVIWCTGFRPALSPLAPLGVLDGEGRVTVDGMHARGEPRLWLLGYGSWTGEASATLVGVTRHARQAISEITAFLATDHPGFQSR
jgi:cation diffusion facilitator CzcD-associated flavoprotein CzcO